MASGVPIPASLSAILADQETIEGLRRLDILVDEDTCWRSVDDHDDFGFDLSGQNAVYSFASTTNGDIFGVHVGNQSRMLTDGGAVERLCPVVFLSREGYTLRVSDNLTGFLGTLVSLHIYFTDLIARLSSTDKDSDHDLTKAYIMDLIDRWKREDSGDRDVDELLCRLTSILNLQRVSEKQAVENVFTSELSAPRYLPLRR